ncbi:hypothetical protein Tco_1171373, partial [Tanacetum coccineum]
MAEGADKPKAQWTLDERNVVNQDQRLKSIIISCLPNNIIESVISYETPKDTWTDLVHSFTENSDDEADERTSEEYIRDLDIEFHERALLANSKHNIKRKNNFLGQKANQDTKCYKYGKKCHFTRDYFFKTSEPSYKSPSYSSSVSKGFQPKFISKLIQSSQHAQSSQGEPKVQKDYKTEYKKLKAKLALLEASPPTSQSLKPFQLKNKGLVAEMFDWDEKEVSDEEEETQVKVLMALVDDELLVGKNHARNGEWINITMKKCISEHIPNQKKKNLGSEQLTDSSFKNDVKDNPFVHASLEYDHEMVPKSKDWVERLNPDSSESQTPLPLLKSLQRASPSSENVSGRVTVYNPELVTSSVPTEVKANDQVSKFNELTKLVLMLMDERINSTQKMQEPKIVSSQPESSKLVNSSKQSHDSKSNGKNPDSSKPKDHRTSDHDMYIASLRSSQNFKTQPYQCASHSKQILKSKAKPYLPCTHCGFNDHRPDDCRNYPECEICGSYDHFTSKHNRIIQIKGGILAESSQSSESSIGVRCSSCGSSVHSTTDHNDFEHFKRRHIREPIWYLDSRCLRSMTGVKSYLHKYVEQPGPKVVFCDNSSCITEGYGSINCGGIIFSK